MRGWIIAGGAALLLSGAAKAGDEFVGDAEYGEYLASECTTCHLLGVDAPEGGVPLITGWDPETFVYVMEDYKAGFREHGPMQMIAGRLGDEEIAALAAYFATQD